MDFSDFQRLMPAYLEGRLAASLRVEFEACLERSVECRRMLAGLQALEVRLEREMPRPALAPGFAARVLNRIETDPLAVSTAEKAKVKSELEREFRDQLNGMQKAWHNRKYHAVLDSLAFITVLFAIGWLLIPRLQNLSGLAVGMGGWWIHPTIIGCGLLSAACLAFALLIQTRTALGGSLRRAISC